MRAILLSSAVVLAVCFCGKGELLMQANEKTATDQPAARTGELLRHVVLFKFKEGTTPTAIDELVTAFAALPGKISQIQAFEHGTDVSVENLAAGYTHIFLVTFKSTADRDAYLPHPEHKKFVELAQKTVAGALVVDYWAK